MIQYNNYLMKREQSRAGSRFAECEKSRLKAKILITLALLLTAVTGAWADETPLVTITFGYSGPVYSESGIVTVTGSNADPDYNGGKYSWSPTGTIDLMSATVEVAAGYNITKVVFWSNDNGNYANALEDTAEPYVCYSKVSSNGKSLSDDLSNKVDGYNIAKIEVYGTYEPPIEVGGPTIVEGKPQWTFSMPGSDVVLTPIYAKAAAFATTGTGSEVKTLLPEAAEGVIAGTDASLIAEGTGIVAFAGESTEVTQGTLMYAIGTSATQAPALTAFSATVPTAKDVADDGATLYVWYYIQGADAPDGVAATLDNTFNDTEPACLTATVLTNKFDITLKAANANTIEAGKATVTVGGTAATVTDGKLQGVKMGSEVKIKAATGYKFRKVEVKKGAAEPVADIIWDGTNVTDLHVESTYASYTKEGVKLSGNADQVQAEWNNSAYLGTPGMEFITMESGGFTFTAPTGKAFTKIEMKAQGSSGWGSANLGTGWAYNTGTVTWTGSAASTVKLLKDADMFSGDFISSIAFYLSE